MNEAAPLPVTNTAPAPPERLVLFGSFTSSSTYKPMLYLSLARLPFSFRTVNLKFGVQKQPDYLAVNRYGQVPALRQANIYERQSYRHIVGMPSVGEGQGGEITAETPFLVVRTMRDGRMDLFAAGAYLDRLRENADGALRFIERLVICDSSRFDTLLAIPL